MYKSTPSLESIEGRVEKWVEQIKKLELDIRNRDENKEVALGTSKINYMDPRISVAWCKRCDVPIDKVFAKTLRDKFNWYVILSQLLLPYLTVFNLLIVVSFSFYVLRSQGYGCSARLEVRIVCQTVKMCMYNEERRRWQ